MKTLTIISVFLLSINFPVIAQNDVLMGAKSSPKIHYTQNYHKYKNSFFYTDSLQFDASKINVEDYKINYKKSKELSNCVFIDPKEIHSLSNSFFHNSLRYYVDTSFLSLKPNSLLMKLDTSFKIPFDKYNKPFYFSKFEVTNREYHEFTDWVIDSISRNTLIEEDFLQYGRKDKTGNYIINWETPIDWNNEDIFDALFETFYLQNGYYSSTNKKIDSRKVKYQLNNDEVIQVYPNTHLIHSKLGIQYCEPYKVHPFLHPAYFDYPVTNISYYQTIAFLEWKTNQFQKELNEKGVNLKIKFDLPTIAEWEMVSSMEIDDENQYVIKSNYLYYKDESWSSDLTLEEEFIEYEDSTCVRLNGTTIYKSIRKDELFLQNKKTLISNLEIDFRDFEGYPVNINKKKTTDSFILGNIDDFGICHMGSNVSEWLKESYQENWRPIFQKRQEMLNTFDDEDVKILAMMEAYYDRKNHPNGRLVKGANWYDERFSNVLGKNIEGINAKVFADPKRGYSTVGFRYVIRVYPK